jgi:hypothetical protein
MILCELAYNLNLTRIAHPYASITLLRVSYGSRL